MHRRWPAILAIGLLSASACARDFFIAPSGQDSADGLSPNTALKSFAAAAHQMHPGDVLRLQRGGTWHETLRLPSGAPNRPIRVTAYGGGDLPVIDGGNSLDICIDASASYVIIDSLRITGAAAKDRGAITVWANEDRAGITIEDCRIENNAGRAIWIAGDAGKRVDWVYIHHNVIADNAGSGVLATKLAYSWVIDNDFTGNCRESIDPWQAAVRVWSPDVQSFFVSNNRINNGLHDLDRGAGMGVHIDETGPGIFVTGNDIRHCDSAGIEIENTRGVRVQDNTIVDAHTGVFVYRAGHDHVIDHNTIFARSQGIVLQGWLAHGVDAGPEIEVDGQLLTGNSITHNIAVAQQYGSLKLVGGGERLTGDRANIVTQNAFGPKRPALIEFGDGTLGDYAALTPKKILQSRAGEVPVKIVDQGNSNLQGDWGDFGARHFPTTPKN